MKPLVL